MPKSGAGQIWGPKTNFGHIEVPEPTAKEVDDLRNELDCVYCKVAVVYPSCSWYFRQLVTLASLLIFKTNVTQQTHRWREALKDWTLITSQKWNDEDIKRRR